MNAPGLSLFQGHTNININDDEAQKELEEEARKEQEERNKELGNQLMNAFDDLDELDEDDLTVDSSSHIISRISENDEDVFQHHTPVLTNGYRYNGAHSDSDGQEFINHGDNNYKTNQFIINNPKFVQMQNDYNNQGGDGDSFPKDYRNSNNALNYEEEERKYLESKFGSIEQLKVLYDVRVREVQNLATQLEESRLHSEHTISELRKQLLLSEADKERAVLSRQQAQELLVQTKSELGESHNKIDSLNSTINYLEQEKETLKNELMIAKASLQDSYQRLQIIDRGFSNDKQLEVILKSTKENHAEEVKNLENTINHMKNRLENCEIEIKQLETRNKELYRERERMVLDKAETVNELAKKLEETQKQYQALLTHSKTSGEVLDVAEMKQKFIGMEMENETLKRQLDEALNMLESLSLEAPSSHNVDTESDVETDSMIDMNLKKRTQNKQTSKLNLTDKLFKLQNELYRCMQMHKERRNEIKMLQEALENKEAQIKSLKENESQAMFQATHYREESLKLTEKLLHANEKLTQVETNMPKHNDMVVEMNREKNQLYQDCEKLKLENMRLNQKIENMEMCLNRQNNDDDVDDPAQSKPNRTVIEALKTENKTLLDKISQLEHFSKMNRLINAESTPLPGSKTSFLKSPGKDVDLRSLNMEIDKLKYQLADAQKEIDRYKTLYIELSVEKDKLVKELNDVKSQDFVVKLKDMQNVVNKLENDLDAANKKIYELNEQLIQRGKSGMKAQDKSHNCTEHSDVIQKLESECVKLRDNCSLHKRDIIDLNKKLLDAGQEIKDLKVDLESRKYRDSMIEDMKAKAQKFEEFMMQNMSKTKHSINNTIKTSKSTETDGDWKKSVRNIGVGTDGKINLEELENIHEKHQDEILQCERKVREELSLLFAEEIKNLDDKYRSEKLVLEDNLQKLIQTLQVRTKEVELLKTAVLSERDCYRKSLEEKEKIINDKSREIDVGVVQKYEAKIEMCEERIQTLMTTLDENTKTLQAERDNNCALRMELLNENKNLKQQIADIDKQLTSLSEKYSKSKKCVETYKAYIADKEEHFMNEIERIKQGYELSVTKMKNKMERNIERREKEISEHLKDIERKYQNKLANSEINEEYKVTKQSSRY